MAHNFFNFFSKKPKEEQPPSFIAKAMLAQLIKYLYIDRRFDVADPRLSERRASWVSVALESIGEYEAKLSVFARDGVTITLVSSTAHIMKYTINEELRDILVDYLKWLLSMPPPRRHLFYRGYIMLGDMYVPRQSAVLESLMKDRFYSLEPRFRELRGYIKRRPAYLIALSRIAARGNIKLQERVNTLEENIIRSTGITKEDVVSCEEEVLRFTELGLLF